MAQAAQIKAPRPADRARTGEKLQTKLTVGPANDRFEREADRIADSVTARRQPAPGAPPPTISGLSVQRALAPVAASGPEKADKDAAAPEKRAQRAAVPVAQTGPEKTDDNSAAPENRAQRAVRGQGPEAAPKRPSTPAKIDDRKASAPTKVAQGERAPTAAAEPGTATGLAGGNAPDRVEASVEHMRRRPVPGLDPATRDRMEQAIGTDLGGVRVHTGQSADQAAQSLGARAFTVGQDMFFAQGQFNPSTTAGQRLIAHELTHTVQQRGGSAGAQRVQRETGGKSQIKEDEEPVAGKVKTMSGPDWAIGVTPTQNSQGTLTVPKLELPTVNGVLKGTKGGDFDPKSVTGEIPKANAAYERPPVTEREDRAGKAPAELWREYIKGKYSEDFEKKLVTQLATQKDVAPITDGKDAVYVVKRKAEKAASAQFLMVGTPAELARHDGLLRPMMKRDTNKYSPVDADHILEDQLGGLDDASNLWLLGRSYNRSIGPQISDHLNKSIESTLEKVKKEREKQRKAGVTLDGRVPTDTVKIRRQWTIIFKTVGGGKFSGTPETYWSETDIAKEDYLSKHFDALTGPELFTQGFKFDETKEVKPTHINVFPTKEGGKLYRFTVSKDQKKLTLPDGEFFKGIDIVKTVSFTPPTSKDVGGDLAVLQVKYTKRKDSKNPDSELVQAKGPITIRHDPRLGFGGYVTRESIRNAFDGATFKPFSPLSFPDIGVSPDGELTGTGHIESTKALLPGLKIPIELRGSDIFINFPIPTEKLNFGPVSVTDAALELGVGATGFFIAGSADIAVQQVGHGTISARVEKDDVILKGIFNLDLDFLDPAQVEVTYSLAKDDFVAKATLGVKKKKLPGVESGQVTIEVSRNEFGLIGELKLGGLLSGSVITAGYTKATGLVIEGKELPLPVGKLPGVSDAKVTVRAVRNPETGVWLISGGGKASLVAPGASATLDIFFDGVSVTFKGRAAVAKGPASGWLDVTATNRAVDDAGNPIEGGPVGELKIWGKGEASLKFGKILTGTVGIEYTPDGHVILSGEIALPPTFQLFRKIPYTKSLLSVHPPDFPIWGVKVGPVGIGIFAFVEAEIRFDAYVGPGELRDTKLKATLDLEKPEEAMVEGHAQFYVPAYAGLTLDLGGGLKAQVAVAYVKGKLGLEGTLGAMIEGSFDVDVSWNQADGFAVGADAKIVAHPKFELGVYASVTAGVDLWLTSIEKEWGPWRHKLGEFGPNLDLGVEMPLHWSEKDGLDLSLDDIKVIKPKLDAIDLMKDAFDTLI